MMRILVLSQQITNTYMKMLSSAFSEVGNIVVITNSQLTEVSVVKAPKYNTRSGFDRIKSWIKYVVFVLKWSKRHKRETFDVVFATSNPPLNSWLGYKLKHVFNARFIYMNWDLYPQAIQMNFEGFIYRWIANIWRAINCYLYPRIDQMLTIGGTIAKTINKGINREIDIKVIPMFSDSERLYPMQKHTNSFCIDQKICDKFIVLYSGKMGLGHNLDIMLESSKYLVDYDDILLLFVGEGPKYGQIEKWIVNNSPTNVRLLPLQDESVFPMSMASGDIGFVSQEKKSSQCFMPSKVFDMMACGMPIIAYSSGEDDLSVMIRKEQVGIVITEDNPELFAKSVIRLYNDSALLKRYSSNSRKAVKERYCVDKVSNQYKEVLRDLF